MLSLLLESALRSLVLGGAVWIGLRALRVRNTHTQVLAWTLVLAAALLMPLMMRWPVLVMAVPSAPMSRVAPAIRTITLAGTALPKATPHAPLDWRSAVEYVYLAIAALLFLRMLIGFALTARLWHRAVGVSEEWTAGMNVRSSAEISVPVTFGATILIPVEWPEWDATKRKAVLLHESSHVERRDFYLHLLAGLHRVVFWFSPLSWWLVKRIAELSEAACDDAAIGQLEDRPSYAGILLDFAKKRQPASAGVAMARPATVSRRVDRILAETQLSLPPGLGRKLLLVALIAPLIAVIAGSSMRAQNPAASPAPSSKSQKIQLSDDSDEAYAIVSGGSMTASGSSSDMRRARLLRDKVHGDYIWFERDLKFYYITDRATVERAKELFRPQQELGRRQGILGEQQGKLGEEQGLLGERQANVSVTAPNLTSQLDKLHRELEQLQEAAQVRQENLADLQDKIGALQGELGELQTQAGEKQAKLGEMQAKVGEQQAKLGEEQARLGEQQAQLAKEASRKMSILLDEALRNGMAQRVE